MDSAHSCLWVQYASAYASVVTNLSSILVVDDDKDVLHAARLALADHFESIVTSTAMNDIEALLSPQVKVVLLDMNFALGVHNGQHGLEGLERIRIVDPTLSVVLMTAFGSVNLAVEALKRGAVDFILKPWRNEKLVAAALTAAERTDTSRRGEAMDLESVERITIQRALDQYQGNISLAAAALGLSRPALYRRMSKHGLQ
jgi:DNA-binding NtrC family response regulator